jgi:hypothetical protein
VTRGQSNLPRHVQLFNIRRSSTGKDQTGAADETKLRDDEALLGSVDELSDDTIGEEPVHLDGSSSYSYAEEETLHSQISSLELESESSSPAIKQSSEPPMHTKEVALQSKPPESGAAIEIKAANSDHYERPGPGASIGAYVNGRHLPPVTLGGLIEIDGKLYGLTVHHMLDDPESDDGQEEEDELPV